MGTATLDQTAAAADTFPINGTDFVVCWSDTPSGGGQAQIFYTRVTPAKIIGLTALVPAATAPINQAAFFMAPQKPYPAHAIITLLTATPQRCGMAKKARRAGHKPILAANSEEPPWPTRATIPLRCGRI